ncbi:MAG: 30S ribosomal protein S16 [Candidatus Levybacteria bacterium]|nr:30S ribosomal protein S16 [Candidatus Levybacteria bacterium]
MSVVIRSTRIGKRGERKFRIVVKEKRSARDGKAIELLGYYEKGKKESLKIAPTIVIEKLLN